MKKLLVLAAVAVACVTVTQGAAFVWKTKASNQIYLSGGDAKLTSGTAYVFDAAQVSQSSLVSALVAGNLNLASGALDTSSITDGAISVKEDTVTYGTNPNVYDMYIAVLNGDSLFISDTVEYTAPAGADAQQLQFACKNSSKGAAMDAKNGYSAAGWYAVPEPTSGLMLLLGVGLMALRRRHA